MYSNPRVYLATWIFIVLYIILTAIFLSIFVQNNSPIYTWFANLGAPGSALLSFRGTFVSVCIRLTIISHVMTVGIIALLIYNRSDRGLSYFFYGLYLILVLFTLLGVVATSTEYASCNQRFGNLCNDPRYCCANPADGSGCGNPLACTDPVVLPTDLVPNQEFLGLFWMNFVLFFMQLGFAITVVVLDRRGGGTETKEEPPKETDETAPQAVPPLEPLTGAISSPPLRGGDEIARTHGLRKRV